MKTHAPELPRLSYGTKTKNIERYDQELPSRFKSQVVSYAMEVA